MIPSLFIRDLKKGPAHAPILYVTSLISSAASAFIFLDLTSANYGTTVLRPYVGAAACHPEQSYIRRAQMHGQENLDIDQIPSANAKSVCTTWRSPTVERSAPTAALELRGCVDRPGLQSQ